MVGIELYEISLFFAFTPNIIKDPTPKQTPNHHC